MDAQEIERIRAAIEKVRAIRQVHPAVVELQAETADALCDAASQLREAERVIEAARDVDECEWQSGTGRYKALHESLAAFDAKQKEGAS